MKRVGITPDGRKVIDRIETARLAGLEDYAASLTPEQRATPLLRPLQPPPSLMTRIRSAITDDNRRWWTLGAMCFALFMIMLDNTVVNVALPSIQKDLHSSISGLEWTVNAYTLSFAVLLVTGGRLGDIFGRRRMFLLRRRRLRPLERLHRPLAERGLARRRARRAGHRRRVHDAGDPLDHHQRLPRRTSAARRSAPGPASAPWRSPSAPWSAASSSRTSPGSRSSSSTSRWPSLAVVVTLAATRESRDESSTHHVDFPGVATITVGLAALVLALVEGNSLGLGLGRDRRAARRLGHRR